MLHFTIATITLTILSLTVAPTNNNTQASPDWFQIILIALPIILTIIAGGIGYLYKSEREKRIEIEKQLLDKKHEIYAQIIDLMMRMIIEKTTDELTDKLNKCNRELIIYGSDNVIKAIQGYLKGITLIDSISEEDREKMSQKIFGDIFLQIRKDMGNKKTRLTPYDLMHLVITIVETKVSESTQNETSGT